MTRTNTFLKRIAICLVAGSLTACAVAPDTITHDLPNKKYEAPTVKGTSGAIFKNAAYRPLFEDYRARMIGDTLTIVINEATTAGKDSNASSAHEGSASSSVSNLFGSAAAKLALEASSSVEYEDEAETTSGNNFNGTIAVTVVDVFPNGNMLVSGEKQIALDKGAEFIRISGVVNPRSVTAGNEISSSQVADVRVEYRTNSRLDSSDVMSMVARLFLSVAPF